MHISSRTIATTLSTLVLIAIPLLAQETTAPTQTSPLDIAPTQTSPIDIAPTVAAQESTPVRANSKVRIVRLSEVKGEVHLDRATGRGFEEAMPNLPIVEQARLQTGAGVAEVEFEDNSTLRLAPDSLVEFSQLELLPSGAKASTMTLRRGTVYASLVNTKGNDFTLVFNQQKIHLQPSSHVRLQLQPTEASLAVLDGSVSVEGSSGTTQIGKKKTLTFDLASQNQPVEAKNVASEPFDSWDQHAADYHKSFANQSAFGNSSYSYGVSDMLYYGNFVNTSCGSMWRPYFVSAAWDPFDNGTWAWYSGAGYSWVSPYPWGWTPYHSGNWTSCRGTGWGWQPGGAWYGLNNAMVSPKVNGVNGNPVHVSPPGKPPVSGQSTLVPVSLKPLTSSDFASRDSFVFRNDSAGLGIPRGSFGKLNEISDQAAHRGSISAPVYYPSSSTASGSTRPENTRQDSFRSAFPEHTQSGRTSISSGSSIGRSSNESVSAPAPGPVTGPGRTH